MPTKRNVKKEQGADQRKAGELTAEELDSVTGGTDAALEAASTTKPMEMNSWLEAAQAGMMDQALPKKRKS
jgi:hypothetical protein